MKLKELIGFDGNNFVLGTHDLKGKPRSEKNGNLLAASYDPQQVNRMLAELFMGGDQASHALMAQVILEPIEQVVPYVEMYGQFFMEQNYGPTDDNSIAVEDIMAMAWETHQDAAVNFVRSGFYFTRPTFQTWDAGLEVSWEAVKKAGWNYLARQMRRTMEALARKRDAVAVATLRTALIASHSYNVSTSMTKVAVDTLIKDQAAIGFPVNRALVNSGRIVDMFSASAWPWPVGFFVPPEQANQFLTTLYLGNYGGVQWYVNPHAPINEILFGGASNQIGWHQTRGSLTQASDIDIRNKVDLHAIYDAEHAWYVGNPYTLARIVIT